mgnify:FL=1|jgi:hypothetical protein
MTTITGASRAVEAANWLKQKGWEYSVEVKNNSPFSGIYNFTLNNTEQEFIFKLTWSQ